MSKDKSLSKVCVISPSSEIRQKFIRKFAPGKSEDDYVPALGVDITTIQVQINNNVVKLVIVDLPYQAFKEKLRPSYFRGASACIITLDRRPETT